MPNELNIHKKVEFGGMAGHRLNVYGPMGEYKRHDSDRFMGIALDTTNDWAVSVPGTSDSIAISEVDGGSCLITTGTADNDSCMMAKPIIYTGDSKAICEFQIKISDVSGTGVFVGFSDAKSEANNSIAIHYPDDVLTTVATDAAGFVIDADSATLGASYILCCGVANGTDETTVSTGVQWADGETKRLRVELNDGAATFYLDEARVAYLDAAVTSTTLLCPTVQAITRANDGANTVYVYSFDAWQD